MSVVTVRLTEELDTFLQHFCAEEDRTKAWIIKKALREQMEDWMDYKVGVKALQEHNATGRKTHSLESVAKEFGVRLERKKSKKS